MLYPLAGAHSAGHLLEQIGAHIDLFPTLLDLCGVPVPPALQLDGVSLKPLLLGENPDWPDRPIFTHRTQGDHVTPVCGSLRSQQYRLVNEGNGYQLYDLVNDPGETADLAAANPRVAGAMAADYERIFADVTQEGFDRVPTPVGHPEAPVVDIPAPLAFLENGLEFQGKHGWAHDWITNCIYADCVARFKLNIVSAGRYQVTLFCCCPEADVGSRVRVTVGDATAETALTVPHDPAPLPSPDRIPRQEAYEKVWAPLQFPPFDLPACSVDLLVQAAEIPGNAAMDLRGVRLVWRSCSG